MIQLPPIVESAKKRPLSFNPDAQCFVYYDDVQSGKAKIYPLERLTDGQLLDLAVERQLTDETGGYGVLNGSTYTKAQIAEELRSGSGLGNEMLNADIEYLKFYLSQFPPESFEQ